VVSMTVAFCAVLGLLVQGHKLDTGISGKLMKLVKSGELPFHAVTGDGLQPPRPGDPDPPREGRFASPDALLTPSYMAAAASDPEIRIEPAWKVSIVYGMPCVNGGGQNQVRAILAGTLTGAQVGLRGIPKRFLEGLEKSGDLQHLAETLASQVGNA